MCNMCDIINICSHYVYDCSMKLNVDRLVGVGFMRSFVMRSLKMQLLLWRTLIDWLVIFCMLRIIYRRGVIHWNQYCDSSSVSGMRRKISCIVRKGEKQIQILDGY
jgi:hypothetical protein